MTLWTESRPVPDNLRGLGGSYCSSRSEIYFGPKPFIYKCIYGASFFSDFKADLRAFICVGHRGILVLVSLKRISHTGSKNMCVVSVCSDFTVDSMKNKCDLF